MQMTDSTPCHFAYQIVQFNCVTGWHEIFGSIKVHTSLTYKDVIVKKSIIAVTLLFTSQINIESIILPL